VNSTDCQEWAEKAFLFVEAALCQELATPLRACMSEDYFRSAFVRGLAASMPERAGRIRVEETVVWSRNACINCGVQPSGRPIQHDVAVVDGAETPEFVCEVKWLKRGGSRLIGKDLWKLALTRGTASEGEAVRTYILIGGEADALSNTLSTLRADRGPNFRWSNAGRQAGAPATKEISLERYAQLAGGHEALKELLRWGKTQWHLRTPPECWRRAKLARRSEPWRRTIDGMGWRAVLFELHHHGVQGNGGMNPVEVSGLTCACRRR